MNTVKIVIIVILQIEKYCLSMLQFKTATQSFITALKRNCPKINILVMAISIPTNYVSFDQYFKKSGFFILFFLRNKGEFRNTYWNIDMEPGSDQSKQCLLCFRWRYPTKYKWRTRICSFHRIKPPSLGRCICSLHTMDKNHR